MRPRALLLLLCPAAFVACSPAATERPPLAVMVPSASAAAPSTSTPEPRPRIPLMEWTPLSAKVEMARTEVTVGQFRACVEAGACSSALLHGIDWPGRLAFEPRANCTWPQGNDRLPINCVAFHDAEAFCSFVGGRVQTLDEWMQAASNHHETEWPWGDEPSPGCERTVMGLHEDGCAQDNPMPVCARPLGNNRAGICDLVGNLYEWTARPHDPSVPWVMAGECFNNFAASNALEDMTLAIDDERYRTPPLGIRCVRDTQ